MPPTNQERLSHILDAISKIEARTAGVDESRFGADDQLHDSVLYQLARIGEAVAHLAPETKDRHQAIPWAQIKSFRNRVLHEYHNVSMRIVWNTLKRDLPALRAAVSDELARGQRSDPTHRSQ